MSEYQYYEFQALDRRLGAREMARLRSFSTRARITPTSFVNEYEWGDFKGDEDEWMERYFDAFLYYANWGTRVLKLRLSSGLLDDATAGLYCVAESASSREHEGNTIITFHSDEEEGEWSDESDALSALIPIRAQLARGDLRGLYLGWLRCVQSGELDYEMTEPPVPAGLKELDGSLERLVDFLRVDTDLLEVAANASPAIVAQALTADETRKWVAGLPRAEADVYLERFIAGEESALAAKLQRLIGNRRGVVSTSHQARTVEALLRAAQLAAEERRRAAAERAKAERQRRQHEAAVARTKHLEALGLREPAVWTEIDDLIATKQPASYDRAVGLLVDLRDIAAHGRESEFLARLEGLRTQHGRKPSLLSKLERAGL